MANEELNDYNHPILSYISGHLKFEFYINNDLYVTDLLNKRKYRLIPSLDEAYPFLIVLVNKE